MPDTPVIPLVTFRTQRGAQLSMHIGHLVRTPDGRTWIFPESAEVTQPPHLAGAYETYGDDLEQLPDTPEGVPAYLCRTIFHIPH